MSAMTKITESISLSAERTELIHRVHQYGLTKRFTFYFTFKDSYMEKNRMYSLLGLECSQA